MALREKILKVKQEITELENKTKPKTPKTRLDFRANFLVKI